MATIKKFEDLICWQKARILTKEIYKITKIGDFNKDRGLANQIQRAAVSVMANIAEGFGRGTKQEFINYLFIAKGSCVEVQNHLYVALDAGYMDISTFRNIYMLSDECCRLIQSFINKVKGGSKSGLQHKIIKKSDPAVEMIKEKHPDLYEKYFKKNI
ncbi:MAG: four helix bundle protein [Patescibacteria group bacterium]